MATGALGESDDGPSVTWPFVPLIGPFVQAGLSSGRAESGLVAFLVVDGLVQATGLGMLIGGLAHPVRSLAHDGPRWSLLPSFGAGPGASLRVVF